MSHHGRHTEATRTKPPVSVLPPERREASPAAGPAPTPAPVHAPEANHRHLFSFLYRAGRILVQFGVILLGVFALTHVLLKLGGNALWLPVERRESLEIMVSTIGLLVYGLSQHFAKPRPAVLRKLLAIAAMVLAIATFLFYNQIAGRCVRSFQPSDGWWERQFSDSTRAAPSAAGQGAAASSDAIPYFLDRQRNTVFIPLSWDPKFLQILEDRGNGDAETGLDDILGHDPMTLVDHLQTAPGRASLDPACSLLTWLHIVLVTLVAGAAGATYSPAESLAEQIAHLLGGKS